MTALTGIHVFEKRGVIEWEPAIVAMQLLSALSWKRYHGKIELYTNEPWLEVLKRYGVDSVYDIVDTEELKNQPPEIDHTKFWSWPKMHIARTLTPDRVMLDTDLWITSAIVLDQGSDFMGFHEEVPSSTDPITPYPDFDDMIPTDMIGRFDKLVLPMNAAILWIQNSELRDKWLETAHRIVTSPYSIKVDDPRQVIHAVFVEQRLLPMIANELGAKSATFLPCKYLTDSEVVATGDCWIPRPTEWSPTQRLTVEKVRHVWGCKRLWTFDEPLRIHQFHVIAHELSRYSNVYNVQQLVDSLISYPS